MKTSRTKCISVLLGIVIIAVLGLSSCQEAAVAPPASSGSGSGPDVGRPEDLASTGAASFPTTQQAAVDLFTRTMTSFSAGVGPAGIASLAVQCEQFTVESFDEPINWTGAVGGGTANITGSMSGSYRGPSECFLPAANTSYQPLVNLSMALQMSGTVSAATVPCTISPTTNYTINQGRLTNALNVTATVNAWTDANAEIVTAKMDFAYSLNYGTALSVRCQGGPYNGMGAKFLLSFADSISRTDVTLDEGSAQAFQNDVTASLNSKSAVLRVYNDANALIGEYAIPLSQLPGGNPISM